MNRIRGEFNRLASLVKPKTTSVAMSKTNSTLVVPANKAAEPYAALTGLLRQEAPRT
jgi:hypothetical protein